jgi:hypothetical protein
MDMQMLEFEILAKHDDYLLDILVDVPRGMDRLFKESVKIAKMLGTGKYHNVGQDLEDTFDKDDLILRYHEILTLMQNVVKIDQLTEQPQHAN